jgi:hypothetical protein
MKILRDYIRAILTESLDPRIERRVDTLMQMKQRVGIQIRDAEDGTEIRYARISKDKDGNATIKSPVGKSVPKGSITITNDHDSGPCMSDLGEPWVVFIVQSGEGWGPLLYDVALEYASSNGAGLMSDRKIVSDMARPVWDIYDTRGDVRKFQLDISHDEDLADESEMQIPQLTPDVENDDCVQSKAIEVGGVEGWMKTPLSRLYRKEGTPVMDALRNAGLLWEE